LTDPDQTQVFPAAMTDDIVASSRDGIITIDPHGVLTSFNPRR
jgi:PAS domain-containing protein